VPSVRRSPLPAPAKKENAHEKNSLSLSPIHSLMLVGWGGNNGSTVTAGILANKL
jgi:hypothetical protein